MKKQFIFLPIIFFFFSCNTKNKKNEYLNKSESAKGIADSLLFKSGEYLFFTNNLSQDNQISCSSCHKPKESFQDSYERALSRTKVLNRNTPTLLNLPFYNAFFWDGRANTLEQQLNEVLFAKNEINSNNTIIDSLVSNNSLLNKTFNQNDISYKNETDFVIDALKTFILSTCTKQTKYSKYVSGESALNSSALRGLTIFNGKGKCNTCHIEPNFNDNKFHNHGLYKRRIVIESFNSSKGKQFRLGFDYGRGNIVGGQENLFSFRTPSLINVLNTAPYMHDGSFRTINEVIDFYNRGGDDKNSKLDILNLTNLEKADLISFLNTLTDEKQLKTTANN
jgi:cytochrome c peroxidase